MWDLETKTVAEHTSKKIIKLARIRLEPLHFESWLFIVPVSPDV